MLVNPSLKEHLQVYSDLPVFWNSPVNDFGIRPWKIYFNEINSGGTLHQTLFKPDYFDSGSQ